MELGHLLTRSGLTYPEVSSKVYHDSFCQLGSSYFITLGNLFQGILFIIIILFYHVLYIKITHLVDKEIKNGKSMVVRICTNGKKFTEINNLISSH